MEHTRHSKGDHIINCHRDRFQLWCQDFDWITIACKFAAVTASLLATYSAFLLWFCYGVGWILLIPAAEWGMTVWLLQVSFSAPKKVCLNFVWLAVGTAAWTVVERAFLGSFLSYYMHWFDQWSPDLAWRNYQEQFGEPAVDIWLVFVLGTTLLIAKIVVTAWLVVQGKTRNSQL